MNSAEPDQVHIEQLEVFARVGVTENERSKPQRLCLSITAWPNDPFEMLEDKIDNAVNYSAVCASAREFMREQSFALIETFAAELAARLLRTFSIQRVHLEIRKFVVPDAQHVSVSLTRSA